MNLTDCISNTFSEQCKNNSPIGINKRMDYLVRLEHWIKDNEKRIKVAHFKDLRKPESEIELAEIWYVLSEIRIAKKNLKKWMRPKRIGKSTLALATAQSWLHNEPRGVVLIISPWNFPFNLTIGPLVSALAAGNRVIIKPSELTPNVSSLMARMVDEVFEPERVSIFQGDQEVAKELLNYPFDHIFFTGSPSIGKIIMKAASKHLSSLTLELGGKSPTIIDDTAKVKMAVNKITWGKCINLGQSCISPDYILIHESKKNEFIDELSNNLDRVYGRSFAQKTQSLDLARVVNLRHFERLDDLLCTAIEDGAVIAHGGGRDKNNLFIEPTLLDSIKLDMKIMHEEIFGPLLPIVSYKNLDECIEIINQRTKPLAIYMFSQSKRNINTIIDKTSSGGMVVNEVKSHFLNLDLPFGGVNESGTGRSHGYHGFITFSNQRSMQKNGQFSMVGLTFPPYTEWTKKIIRLVSRYF